MYVFGGVHVLSVLAVVACQERSANHLVEAQHHAVAVHSERVSATEVSVLDCVTGHAVQVERDLLPILFHAVRVELGLAGPVAAELAAMLLTLERVGCAGRVRVRLQIMRVPPLGLERVNLAVARPAPLTARHPEARPRGATLWQLDARLSVEVALRRVLDVPVTVPRLDHRGRERGRVLAPLTVLGARARAVHGFHALGFLVPLFPGWGVAGDQVQVAAGHVHVLGAVRVVRLRSRVRVEARVAIPPFGGVQRIAVELVLEADLVVSLRAHRFRQGGRASAVRPHGGRTARADDTACDCRARRERKQSA